MTEGRNPCPTVDVIIELKGQGIVLILRRNPPRSWALPGGYVDYGESLEEAAVREAREETALHVELIRQFHTYSDPRRDRRQHNITTVFIARAEGDPVAGDDAEQVAVFPLDRLPRALAFDHAEILRDYTERRY